MSLSFRYTRTCALSFALANVCLTASVWPGFAGSIVVSYVVPSMTHLAETVGRSAAMSSATSVNDFRTPRETGSTVCPAMSGVRYWPAAVTDMSCGGTLVMAKLSVPAV